AWLTAFLAAIWPRLIEYSQEMRSYALFVLLASTSGFALLRALRTNQTRYWILFASAATFELYVHHLALLNVFSFFLFALVSICFGIPNYPLRRGQLFALDGATLVSSVR